ncbi:hypothetical protein V2G26_012272 [Clonostachys chloroleuca]
MYPGDLFSALSTACWPQLQKCPQASHQPVVKNYNDSNVTILMSFNSRSACYARNNSGILLFVIRTIFLLQPRFVPHSIDRRVSPVAEIVHVLLASSLATQNLRTGSAFEIWG